jgi:predicted MFS family arabinose efflux permease
VLAVIIGAVLGGEAVGWHTVFGTTLIVGAVVTIVSRPRPTIAAPAPPSDDTTDAAVRAAIEERPASR